ncbi:MAG: cupredoxin domain-containing protein [Actinomycetota bacterium]|nr:cupredoxin domain-containing protein [Actinomycetota bacterium]
MRHTMWPIGLRSLIAGTAACSLLLVTACGDDEEAESTSPEETTSQTTAQGTSAPSSAPGTTMPPMTGGSTAPPSTGSPDTTTGSTGQQGEGGAVTIADFAFDPAEIEVAAGATVTWTNEDSATHTVESDDDTLMSGDLDNGATYEMTFDEPGTYQYVCGIHPNMEGTVIVK